MDFSLTLFVFAIITAPLIIAIIYFFQIIYKAPSLFVIELLLADVCNLIWNLAGIPVLIPQNIFNNVDLIIIEELGVIFGSFGFIIIYFVFNTPYYGNKQLILSRIGILAFALITGVKIALILINNTSKSIYGLYILNGTLKRYTDPVIQILVLIAFLFLVIVLFMYSIWQKKFPEFLINKNIKNNSIYATIMMGIGVSMNYVGLLSPILNYANILFLVSRFFISFSFIFITMMVAQNPIIILREKGNPNYLVENGIVGWLLIINTDLGPEPKIVSEKSRKLYDLQEKDLMLCAVSSISIVGIGQNFTNTEFIIPYPSRERELSVLCYSFTIKDPTLQDPRRENKADVVYGIILPKILLQYLGMFQGSFTITRKVTAEKTIQELLSQVDFSQETLLTFRNLLLQKAI